MSETINNIIRFNYSVDPTTLMSNSWITNNTDTTQNTVTGIDPTTVTTTYRDVTYSISAKGSVLESGVLRVVYISRLGEFVVESIEALSGNTIDDWGYKDDIDELDINIGKNVYRFYNFSTATENTTYTDDLGDMVNTWSYINGTSTVTTYDHYEVELYVNSDVTTFPNNLFYYDSHITSIEFDTYSITSIEDGVDKSSGAFYECVNLMSIILPDNFEYIGDYAFSFGGITKYMNITLLSSIPPVIANAAFNNITLDLSVHVNSLQSYINSDWAEYVKNILTIETPKYDNVLKLNYSEDPTTFLSTSLWVNSCTDTSANTIVGVGEHTEEVTVTHYWRTITFDFTGKAPFSGVFRIKVDENGIPDTSVFESLSGDEVNYVEYQINVSRLVFANTDTGGGIGACNDFPTAIENTVYTETDDITGTWSYVNSTTTTTEIITTYDHYEVTLYINSALNTFETTMFAEDTNLLTIDFDYDVTFIGDSAFNACTSLTDVTLNTPVPPTLGDDVFKNVNATLYVPFPSLNIYRQEMGDIFPTIKPIKLPAKSYGFNLSGMKNVDYGKQGVIILRN